MVKLWIYSFFNISAKWGVNGQLHSPTALLRYPSNQAVSCDAQLSGRFGEEINLFSAPKILFL